MGGLLILGAGGYGRTVAEAAAEQFEQIAFLDDGMAADAVGACALYSQLRGQYTFAYPAFGDNAVRSAWIERLLDVGYQLPRLVHSRAYVSPSALLQDGVVVLPMACVGARTQIHCGAIVNMSAVVDHDCIVGACAHLAPGAVVKAGNHIAPQEKVESGTVRERQAY